MTSRLPIGTGRSEQAHRFTARGTRPCRRTARGTGRPRRSAVRGALLAAAVLTLLATIGGGAAASASTAAPPFKGSVHTIGAQLRANMLATGAWKPGVPVSISQLRLLKLSYWGFDGKVHTGDLMVNAEYAKPLVTVFAKLYAMKFHIRHMRLIDAYGASDEKSMADDNTSAFNGRFVPGTTRWSMHSYGLAVDINTVENPYVDSTHVSPVAGTRYADRNLHAMGMIHAGDPVVRAFESIGWKWGGYWSGARDYQHFSSNGG